MTDHGSTDRGGLVGSNCNIYSESGKAQREKAVANKKMVGVLFAWPGHDPSMDISTQCLNI